MEKMPIFNPEIESMNRKSLMELQLERLQIVVNQAYSNVDFYRKKFDEVGLSPDDIKTIDDLQRIPFTNRKDLMDNYPYGMFAVPLRDVVRLQFPLGMYGNPIVIGYTREDLKIWRELVARIMVGVGITEHDIIQVAFNYGLFVGANRFNQSAELIGAAVIPASIASAEVQIRIMQDFRSTVLTSAPSFALYIAEAIEKKGIDPRTLSLKIGLFGAESWPEEVRKVLEEKLNIQAYEIFGVTELIEPGVAGECMAKSGLHVFEDHFLPEIIDPLSGKVLAEGGEGELVLTMLTASGYPLLRYRTSDVTSLRTDPCSCGRTMTRMTKVLRRTDPMLCIRGINVFPEKVGEVLGNFKGLGPGYSLVPTGRRGMNDQLTVRLEAAPEILGDSEDRKMLLKERIQLAFHRAVGLGVEVEFTEIGKSGGASRGGIVGTVRR